MRKSVLVFIIGVGIGNVISFLNLWGYGFREISLSTWASISLLSGFIGLVSLVFDIEALPFKKALPLHFVFVLGIVALMNWFNGWKAGILSVRFLLFFVLIYLVVWGLVAYLNHQQISKINMKLQERKKKTLQKK